MWRRGWGYCGGAARRVFVLLACLARLSAREGAPPPGAEPCAPVDCHETAGCWGSVARYTARGQALAAAGLTGAAMNCFTLAANAVQDERLLGRPAALPARERLALHRLYVSAAQTLLALAGAGGGAGQGGDADEHAATAQQWLLRAAQIASPSVEVLFQEDPPAAGAQPPAPAGRAPTARAGRAPDAGTGAAAAPPAAPAEPPPAAAATAAAEWPGGACRIPEARAGARQRDAAFRCLFQQMLPLLAAPAGGARGRDWAGIAAEHLRVGAKLYAAGHVEEGVRCVRMAVRLLPQGDMSLASRGVGGDGGGDEGGGPAGGERMWMALMTLGEMLANQGRHAEALPLLARAVQRLELRGGVVAGSTGSSALGRLTRTACAEAYRLRDDVGSAHAALALLERVQQADLLPRDHVLAQLPGSVDAAARLALDTCAAARLVRQLPKALHACQRVLHLLEQLQRPRQGGAGAGVDEKLLSNAHFNTGVTLFDMRRWEESVLHLRASLSLRPAALDARCR